jgi:CDP-diacylglycerol--serine O-phosphatidyltransferase
VASVAAYALCGAARLARFNVQTTAIGPAWSRGLPVTIAAGLVSTFILAAWELALPSVVVASTPAVLLGCAVLMISTLWLPKSVDRATRAHVAPLAVGATVIYGLALMRALPVVLFAGALTYAAGGFVVARLHAPTRAALHTPERSDPDDPPHVA